MHGGLQSDPPRILPRRRDGHNRCLAATTEARRTIVPVEAWASSAASRGCGGRCSTGSTFILRSGGALARAGRRAGWRRLLRDSRAGGSGARAAAGALRRASGVFASAHMAPKRGDSVSESGSVLGPGKGGLLGFSSYPSVAVREGVPCSRSITMESRRDQAPRFIRSRGELAR